MHRESFFDIIFDIFGLYLYILYIYIYIYIYILYIEEKILNKY